VRRWGYRVRKVLLTPWGMVPGLRLPRIRDVEAKREVAFLSSEGTPAPLAEMWQASTWGGMPSRQVVKWARRPRSGVRLVAIGLDGGGGFRVLDGQVAEAESTEAYAAPFQRLSERGLEEVPLMVADGCGSVPQRPDRPSQGPAPAWSAS